MYISAGALGLAAVLLTGIAPAQWNPYDREVAGLKKEAAKLDAEIASARSQAECEFLATRYLAQKLLEAQFLTQELKPNVEELLTPREFHPKPNPPPFDALEDMTDHMKRNVGAAAWGALYLLDCLRHLQDIGVKELDESVPDIVERVLGR